MAPQLSLTGFAWKNLWRRSRTLLTLGGITIGIGALVALASFSRAIEHESAPMSTNRGADIAMASCLAARALPSMAWRLPAAAGGIAT